MLKKKRGIRDAAHSLQLMSHKLWRHERRCRFWCSGWWWQRGMSESRLRIGILCSSLEAPEAPRALSLRPSPGRIGGARSRGLRESNQASRLKHSHCLPKSFGTLSDAADSTGSCVEQSGLLHHLPSLSNLSLTCQMQPANCAMTDVR